MAQQHHHDNLSQHTSQYSCSNDETQRHDPDLKIYMLNICTTVHAPRRQCGYPPRCSIECDTGTILLVRACSRCRNEKKDCGLVLSPTNDTVTLLLHWTSMSRGDKRKSTARVREAWCRDSALQSRWDCSIKYLTNVPNNLQ